MATLIILDRPDPRHIPWFAMGVPWSLEDRATDIDLEAGPHETRIVERRCLDWIRAHRGDSAIRLVATRNFVQPRTALHVNWLLFRDDCVVGLVCSDYATGGDHMKVMTLRATPITVCQQKHTNVFLWLQH